MAPYIANECEPDLDAAAEFEEHMYSLEQMEYDLQCQREAAWDYGEDYYDIEDITDVPVIDVTTSEECPF